MKENLIHRSEKIIYSILTFIVLLYVVFQIINLFIQFLEIFSNYSFNQYNDNNKTSFSEVATTFFNIMISMEILETFRTYENNIIYKSKIIILIAITAMTRKIITIDVKHLDYLTDIGIAALMISLCIGYFYISKSELNEKKY